MNKKTALIFCALLALFSFGFREQQQKSMTDRGTSLNMRDVTYCSPDGVPQRLDFYFPVPNSSPAPAVIYIHGGNLTAGDKTSGAGIVDIPYLVDAGFVVAAINYRLSPAYIFPAHLEDAKCAVRFLRANAVQYNLDPDRIGVYGTSAGGYLAAMLGLTQPDDGFDGGSEYEGVSAAVQAVVTMFGFSTDIGPPEAFGPVSDDEVYKLFSTTYATPDDPPVLLFHGDQDTVVPLEQSQQLHNAILYAGGQATLTVVQNGVHGFEPTNPPMNPNRQDVSLSMVSFFAEHLQLDN